MICFPSATLADFSSISTHTSSNWPVAVVALFIGLITVYIAYHQYAVTKGKFNLDLFEKRLPIYRATIKMLAEVTNPNIDQQVKNEFHSLIDEASFLFGIELQNYMIDISNNYLRYKITYQRFQAYSQDHTIDISDEINTLQKLSDWFLNESRFGAMNKFRPFLDLSKWH